MANNATETSTKSASSRFSSTAHGLFTLAIIGGSIKSLQGQIIAQHCDVCVIFNMCVIRVYFAEGIQPQPMETKESNLNSGISRKKAAQERKAAAKRERDKAYYQQNKEKKIAQVKERRKKIAMREVNSATHATRCRENETPKKGNGAKRSFPYRSARKKRKGKATNKRKSAKIP